MNYGPYLTIEEQIALKPTEERRVQYRRTSSDCYIKKVQSKNQFPFTQFNSQLGQNCHPKKVKKAKEEEEKNTFFLIASQLSLPAFVTPLDGWWAENDL